MLAVDLLLTYCSWYVVFNQMLSQLYTDMLTLQRTFLRFSWLTHTEFKHLTNSCRKMLTCSWTCWCTLTYDVDCLVDMNIYSYHFQATDPHHEILYRYTFLFLMPPQNQYSSAWLCWTWILPSVESKRWIKINNVTTIRKLDESHNLFLIFRVASKHYFV